MEHFKATVYTDIPKKEREKNRNQILSFLFFVYAIFCELILHDLLGSYLVAVFHHKEIHAAVNIAVLQLLAERA